MPVRVLLVDDHEMVRKGLAKLLAQEGDMTVIAEAEDGRSAAQMARDLSPDVVVMDLRMPDLNGIDATRQILQSNPNVKVVALSAQSDQRMVTEMLRAGAMGYVVKDAAFEELTAAIRSVIDKKVYLSPSVASEIVKAHLARNPIGEPLPHDGGLSPREREVLQLVAEGKSTKEVAASLNVSIKTVETHRRKLMEKLDLDSVAGLTKYAIREGITSP